MSDRSYGRARPPKLRPVWLCAADCGVTRMELREAGFLRVLCVNDTRHLACV
ncbi:MAG: hypothetical protein ABR563_15475 [Pyrinomonadaceae bacterium]